MGTPTTSMDRTPYCDCWELGGVMKDLCGPLRFVLPVLQLARPFPPVEPTTFESAAWFLGPAWYCWDVVDLIGKAGFACHSFRFFWEDRRGDPRGMSVVHAMRMLVGAFDQEGSTKAFNRTQETREKIPRVSKYLLKRYLHLQTCITASPITF